jgi:hypothetical protein
MNTKRKFVVLLLVVLFFFFNNLAYAENISIEFKYAIRFIGVELGTPFARAGLENIIYQFYIERTKRAPKRYESQARFSGSFLKSFDFFREKLWTENLEKLVANINIKQLKRMEASYEKNSGAFQEFVRTIRDEGGFFRYIEPDVILRSQILYSIILLGGSHDVWVNAQQFTHIWPFCD